MSIKQVYLSISDDHCYIDFYYTTSNENKCLASADEETKERVAKKGGENRAQDKEGLSEA
ncbi:MAG TPA: hypothetical protein VE619_11235 [Nitrososphaeraceae archaeon]|nr:hypothetical protein [Nitrososphaeraceae archaeon]